MHINGFPTEILDQILECVAALNERDGVHYTYGIREALPSFGKPIAVRHKFQRYIRGQRPPVSP